MYLPSGIGARSARTHQRHEGVMPGDVHCAFEATFSMLVTKVGVAD
jgi:hypothetical protein